MRNGERLTEAEARAMVRLWTERQHPDDRPTLTDVAEALEIPLEEARSLLVSVRAAAPLAAQKHSRRRPASYPPYPMRLFGATLALTGLFTAGLERLLS